MAHGLHYVVSQQNYTNIRILRSMVMLIVADVGKIYTTQKPTTAMNADVIIMKIVLMRGRNQTTMIDIITKKKKGVV